jgi:hypothetical protein
MGTLLPWTKTGWISISKKPVRSECWIVSWTRPERDARGSKDFFSEEKKQKTFACAVADSPESRRRHKRMRFEFFS